MILLLLLKSVGNSNSIPFIYYIIVEFKRFELNLIPSG
jgi:hypothetical protein